MKRALLSLLCILPMQFSFAQELKVSSGQVTKKEVFPSVHVQPRDVYIWTPEGYDSTKKHIVLYMHDGQMLFDAAVTWNKMEWQVDESVSLLLQQGKIKDCIVVGIANIPEIRYNDYFPQKAMGYLSKKSRNLPAYDYLKPLSADSYLKFMVYELKPYIDATYSTYIDAKHTFVMGSSMGGLISLYALCEYPSVFGGAACLSMHTPMIAPKLFDFKFTDIVPKAFRSYLAKKLPKANSKLIYMDYGDQTLDAYYAPYQQKIDQLLIQKGWKAPFWETKFFPSTSHSEESWAARLSVPLLFLLGK